MNTARQQREGFFRVCNVHGCYGLICFKKGNTDESCKLKNCTYRTPHITLFSAMNQAARHTCPLCQFSYRQLTLNPPVAYH